MGLGKQKTEVQKGDSLSKIAKNAGISVSKIKELNPQIEDPNLIKPGQQINTSSGILGGIGSLASKLNVTGPPTEAALAAQKAFMDNVGKSDDGPSGIAALNNAETADAQAQADQYAENLRRYNEYMQSQQPQQPAVTPEMRREALNIFESQQGAGQMPYYMAAARGGPNASPAFNYAAQNYGTLGGAQRLASRPMEMMSVAERQRINDMAQGMADQQAAENDYQAGMDMVLRGGGKGGPRTGPQLPPGMVGLPRDPRMIPRDPVMMPRFGGKGGGGVQPQIPPNYGGGMPRPPLPFASILASRFGGFGG